MAMLLGVKENTSRGSPSLRHEATCVDAVDKTPSYAILIPSSTLAYSFVVTASAVQKGESGQSRYCAPPLLGLSIRQAPDMDALEIRQSRGPRSLTFLNRFLTFSEQVFAIMT